MGYKKLYLIGFLASTLLLSGCQNAVVKQKKSDKKESVAIVTETPPKGTNEATEATNPDLSDWDKFTKEYKDFKSKIYSSTDNDNITCLNEEGAQIVHKVLCDALKKPETFGDVTVIASKLNEFLDDVKFGKVVKEGEHEYRTCTFNLKSPKGFGYFGAVYMCERDSKEIKIEKIQSNIPNPMYSGNVDFAGTVIKDGVYVAIIDRRMQDSNEIPNFYKISVMKRNKSWEEVQEFNVPLSSSDGGNLDVKELSNGFALLGDSGTLKKKLIIDESGIALN